MTRGKDATTAAREGQTLRGQGILLRHANLVRLPHTIFALPFALVGVVLASYVAPITLSDVVWVVVAFTTGFLFIYALAAGVLFRRRPFLSSHLESLAHYYLMALFAVSFTRHAIARPLFYIPFVLIAIAALGVRIAAAIRSRKAQVLGAHA